MCKKPLTILVLLLATFTVSSNGMAQISNFPTYNAETQADLEARLRADPAVSKIQKIDINGETVVAVVSDIGFGTYVWTIQVFVNTGTVWDVVFFQRTKTGNVAFKADDGLKELMVFSSDGQPIVKIPYDSVKF